MPMTGNAKERRAYRIGSRDAYAGRPLVDMDDDGSAWLMSELGIESATTERNHAARVRYCEAYADGWFDARSAMGGPAGEAIDFAELHERHSSLEPPE